MSHSAVEFTTLSIKNFLSIGEGTVELRDRGLLLISGRNLDDSSADSNGAGKSSVVDAISWCLFGETARGVSGDSVVNREAGKDCCVSLVVMEGVDEYVVTRHRKHKTGKNRLVVNKNGVELTLGTDKQTQVLIERLIGSNQEVFRAAIYSAQDSMPNLPGMTDKDLKSIVEEAAGITVLERAHEFARSRASLAQGQLDTALAACQRAEATQTRTWDQVLTLREEQSKWSRQHREMMGEQLDGLRKLLAEKQGLAELLRTSREHASDEELAERIEAAMQALRDFNSSAPPAPSPPAPYVEPSRPDTPAEPEEVRALGDQIQKAEKLLATVQADLRVVNRQVDKLQHDLGHIDHKVGTYCGECGKVYSPGDLVEAAAATQVAIDAATGQQRELLGRARKLEVAIELRGKQRDAVVADHANAVRDTLDAWERDAAKSRADYERVTQSYREALEAHHNETARRDSSKLLDALREAQNERQEREHLIHKFATVSTQVEARGEKLRADKATANPFDAQVSRAEAALKVDLAEVEAAREKVDADTTANDDAQAVVKLFSPKGIRGEILDTVTPFLNERTGHYLNHLSDGNISAVWATIGETGKGELREKFHIKVTNDKGADSFEGLSGGEKRKVRLATAMALQDLVATRAHKPIRLFVADEVDDALDQSGLERLLDILGEKARSVGTVLIISHNSISDWVPNEIVVEKSGRCSRIKD
jgi:DNA repair exonuclease SbcCD ATPase subunit